MCTRVNCRWPLLFVCIGGPFCFLIETGTGFEEKETEMVKAVLKASDGEFDHFEL